MKKIFILTLLFIIIHLFASNGIWHWHKKLSFTPDDLEILARLDFTNIYINCGSFYLNGNTPDFDGFEFDENFDKLGSILNNFNIHLVFTFESWGKHTFYRKYLLNNDKSFDFIVSIIKNQITLFKNHGVSINGIQLDLEGYNIDLKMYAMLLKYIRNTFKKYTISITPMVNWLYKKDFIPLLQYIDYYIPMVYDLQRGKKITDKTAITDPIWIKKVIMQCEKLNKPYYIGLPSYYYRIYYNEKNRRVRSWTFVNYEELSESRNFKLIESRKNYSIYNNKLFNGDNIYIFRVERPVFFKYYYFPRGSHILYDVITPNGLKFYYNLVKSMDTKYLEGVSIFRFTKKNEPYLIKTAYYPYIFGNQTLLYDVNVKFLTIDAGSNTITFTVDLKNSGNMESMLNKYGTQLNLKIENAKVSQMVKNNFDSYDITYDENGTCYITLTENFLDLNEEVCSGPISIIYNDSKPLSIKYQTWILGPDGNYHNINMEKWDEVILNGNNN